MNLDAAIEKHAEWKVKFRSAIAKKETMDAHVIAKDDCCELGKWLHGEGKSQYGKLGSHGDCLAKHAVFHAEAGKVAIAINAKDYGGAEAMIAHGTPYSTASSAVGVAIINLKRDAGL